MTLLNPIYSGKKSHSNTLKKMLGCFNQIGVKYGQTQTLG